MELHSNKSAFYPQFPMPVGVGQRGERKTKYVSEKKVKNEREENVAFDENVIDLPVLATANDLREAVKFLKNKPNGVSAVEIMNAEPRRVFDARKIAAYEFWGVLVRDKERIYLTETGSELAESTETECLVNWRILRSIPAYNEALKWIYQQKLDLATYFDVAEFWRKSSAGINLSADNEDQIEAVIVSFFSLCHAAELGTATVGKRGQPARLNVNPDRIGVFVKSLFEKMETDTSLPVKDSDRFSIEKIEPENVARVYISGEKSAEAVNNLFAALELADFENISYVGKTINRGLLPTQQLDAMKKCQAAIFLMNEDDCYKQKGKSLLNCDRIAEISVATALFQDRIVILWQGLKDPPESLKQSGISLLSSENLDWEMNIKLVTYLKNLRK